MTDTLEQVVFAWIYFSLVLFLLVIVPLRVEERTRSYTAFVVTFIIIIFIAIQYYVATRNTLWSR